MDKRKSLVAIDAHDLMEMNLPPPLFCVDTLLPHGLTILGGPSKVGKSWLVLDIAVRVSKGEPLWNLRTRQSGVLYLCLEDNYARVQRRLFAVTDEVPEQRLFLAIQASTLAEGLCEQIREFIAAHADISLVIIDTFQVVRGGEGELSYAADYGDIRQLKTLADSLGIALLLVHHVRKRDDKDPLNKLNGTTGLAGAADTILVLDADPNRLRREAKLVCSGRDIEARELELVFDTEGCVWNAASDTLTQPDSALPEELRALVELLRGQRFYRGGNKELAELIGERVGRNIHPKGLKQQMNKWRYALEQLGVSYRDRQSSNRRIVEITYTPNTEEPPDG